MANIDISQRLSNEKQTITIKDGKTYDIDCSAETMLKANDMFKKDASLTTLYDVLGLLLGQKAVKDIKEMKLSVNNIQIVLLATMAQINEISYEEMEKRFQIPRK